MKSVAILAAATTVLSGLNPALAADPATTYVDSESGRVTAALMMSPLADGLPQPSAPTTCSLIANTGSPFADCSNYSDNSSADVGYYFGFRSGASGGRNVEVDIGSPVSGTGGGWGQNPLAMFLAGSGDGSVTQLILDNENYGSPYKYDGMLLEGEGPTNDLAAIYMTGIGTNWRKGVSIESGVQSDGVLDQSNTWTGLNLSSSHQSGILIDPGTTLTTALMAIPSDPIMGQSNSQWEWTPENGSASGTWEFGPMKTSGANCGLCVQTPQAANGSQGEIDVMPGAGLKVSGAVVSGSVNGLGGAYVIRAVAGRGTGVIVLTTDASASTSSNGLGGDLASLLSADGTAAPLPAIASETLKATIVCNGSLTVLPSVLAVDAIVGGSPKRVLAVNSQRFVGGGMSPTVQVSVDPSGLVPILQVSSGYATSCEAAVTMLLNFVKH